MSFLHDLGGFLGEVQKFNQQVDAVKQEVSSSVVGVLSEGKTVASQITDDVTNATTDAQQTVSSAADDVKQSLNN